MAFSQIIRLRSYLGFKSCQLSVIFPRQFFPLWHFFPSRDIFPRVSFFRDNFFRTYFPMHYFLMAIFSRNILSRNSVFRDIFSRAILSCVINVREIFSQDLNSRIFIPMAFFSQDWDNAQTFHEVYIVYPLDRKIFSPVRQWALISPCRILYTLELFS